MKPGALAAFAAALLLAGCASTPLAPRDARPFDLLGRVLVSSEGSAFTANVRWEHDGAGGEIWLMTPTGQTLAHIVDTDEGATLTRADQQQYHAASVEALTRRAFGWALPLRLMHYWVRGVPAPAPAPGGLERGEGDRLIGLAQGGWRVGLTYHQAGERAGLVRLLEASDGSHQIRMVIDTWRDTKSP